MKKNSPKTVNVKLFGDVVSAIRVLKGQIEFIFL